MIEGMSYVVTEIPERGSRGCNLDIVDAILANPGKAVSMAPCSVKRVRSIRVSFKRRAPHTRLSQLKQGDGYTLWVERTS